MPNPLWSLDLSDLPGWAIDAWNWLRREPEPEPPPREIRYTDLPRSKGAGLVWRSIVEDVARDPLGTELSKVSCNPVPCTCSRCGTQEAA